MADRYIDYWEVSVYGRYCASTVRTLVGASPLVDMEVLAQRILAEVEAVEAEMQRAGFHGSSFRMERGDSGQATKWLRDLLRRFHHHLKTLPPKELDFEAFFAGRKLDGVHRLKPEDLVSRAETVLRGFLVPANAELPGASQWQGALQDAHDALDTAIHGTHRARNNSILATTDMVAARERFLELYNGVAKPLVRGVLRDLGRANEYRRFFRDLQVNESRRPTAPDESDESDESDETGSAG
jgi:hypothetical protein